MKSRLDGYNSIYKTLCKVNEMGPLMLLVNSHAELIMGSVKRINEAVETLDGKSRTINMKIINTDLERVDGALKKITKAMNEDHGVSDMKACLDKINESWKMYE